MGHGIAQVSAMAGYNVVLRDIEQKFLDKAMEKVKWSLDKLVSKEKISKDEGDAIYSRIKPIVDLNDAVKDADLVIEAVPEIMDLKKKVYASVIFLNSFPSSPSLFLSGCNSSANFL